MIVVEVVVAYGSLPDTAEVVIVQGSLSVPVEVEVAQGSLSVPVEVVTIPGSFITFFEAPDPIPVTIQDASMQRV